MSTPVRPRVLSLAGLDPTGGAGLDADREAVEAAGAELLAVATAETDQDGQRVFAVRSRPPAVVEAEAREALAKGSPVALKVGLLPGAAHVRLVARLAAELRGPGLPVVVDPVLAASGGEVFLDGEGRTALLAELVPAGVVLTPNVLELAALTDFAAESCAREPGLRLEAARELLERGAAAVVVKGGHGREDPLRDLVLEAGAEPVWWERERVAGAGLHGSGCRHASALAARLGLGDGLGEAARWAGEWVARRLAERSSE